MKKSKIKTLVIYEKIPLSLVPQKVRHFYDVDGKDVFRPMRIKDKSHGFMVETIESITDVIKNAAGHFTLIEF